MRLIYIIIIIALLYSCNKKDKANINTNPNISKDVTFNKIQKKIPLVKNKFILTEKNSMDFFLEFDKIHKENVVELDTDFGKIEITLFNETKFHRSNFSIITISSLYNKIIDNSIKLCTFEII